MTQLLLLKEVPQRVYQLACVVQRADLLDSHPAHVGDLIGGGVAEVNFAIIEEHPDIFDVLKMLADGGIHQHSPRRVKVDTDLLLGFADGSGQAVFARGDAAADGLPHQRKGRATRRALADEPFALAVSDPHVHHQMVALLRQLFAADVDFAGGFTVPGVQVPKLHMHALLVCALYSTRLVKFLPDGGLYNPSKWVYNG